MKKNTPEPSIEQLVEQLIAKDENLLLSYTVDELIDMAEMGIEINIDGCPTQCPRSRTEE